MWFDTHAHLCDERFRDSLPEVLARAKAAGVTRITVIATDADSSRRAVELAAEHEMLYATVGIHPTYLREKKPGDWERIGELVREPKVIGVGETGMDRYWDESYMDLQNESFLHHLRLGKEHGLPVVIHCRDAEADVLAAFESFAATDQRPIHGIMHSFTGGIDFAERCIEFGLHISFAGMLTYKKNDALREAARTIPVDRLLVETDSPYLSPEPLRGKPNEPAHVIHTGACLARVCGVDRETMARQTTENALRLFALDRKS